MAGILFRARLLAQASKTRWYAVRSGRVWVQECNKSWACCAAFCAVYTEMVCGAVVVDVVDVVVVDVVVVGVAVVVAPLATLFLKLL